LIKKVLKGGLLSLILCSLLLLPGVGLEAASDQGFINLNEARYFHPLGGELEFLERKIGNLQKTFENLYQQQLFFSDLLEKHENQVEKNIKITKDKIKEEFEQKKENIDREIEAKYGAKEEEIREQAREKIADLESELQADYQKEIAENLARFSQEYREFREELRGQYSFEIFNLRLQLQMARLSDEEREQKEAELERLEGKKDAGLRQKEMEISWGMRTISANLQLGVERELSSFVSEQENIVSEAISFLEEEKEGERALLIEKAEEEKVEKIETEEKEIREKAQEDISRVSSNLRDNIEKQLENLIQRMTAAEQEKNIIISRIDNDLLEIAQLLSAEKGIRIEFVEAQDNEEGIDLTKRIKEMMK